MERVSIPRRLFHVADINVVFNFYYVVYLTCDFRVIDDKSPLPPPGATEEEDAVILGDEAYIDGPIKVDYGINLRYSHSLSCEDRPSY